MAVGLWVSGIDAGGVDRDIDPRVARVELIDMHVAAHRLELPLNRASPHLADGEPGVRVGGIDLPRHTRRLLPSRRTSVVHAQERHRSWRPLSGTNPRQLVSELFYLHWLFVASIGVNYNAQR